MRLTAAALASALALGACAASKAAPPEAPQPVAVTVTPVDQWMHGDAPPIGQTGRFVWAGGLQLSAPREAHFGGLSDLDVQADGRLVAISDEGEIVRGRIVTGAKGLLTGVADITKTRLGGPDGMALSGGKSDSDSEGLVRWPNGDLMVSFEGHPRVLFYPANGAAPREVPHPSSDFPVNDGMEALAAAPDDGPGAYLAGREDTRETWICRLAEACVDYLTPGKPEYGKLVAARPLPGRRWAFLFRDFNPVGGVTSRLSITDRKGLELDLLTLARPATVDNIEGVAAIPAANGNIRFYLISDDNFSPQQRTLLLAFDWRPAKRK